MLRNEKITSVYTQPYLFDMRYYDGLCRLQRNYKYINCELKIGYGDFRRLHERRFGTSRAHRKDSNSWGG